MAESGLTSLAAIIAWFIAYWAGSRGGKYG